jgi:hypothetical protein
MTGKTIRIEQVGGTGNQLFQFLFGHLIERQVNDACLYGVDIPDFAMKSPPHPVLPERHLRVTDRHELNVERLVHALNSGLLDAVTLNVFAQRLEYLPDVERARSLLASGIRPELGRAVPDDVLLIHVRWPQVGDAGHGDYMPLPIAYYQRMIDATRLRPVFMGQIDAPEFRAGVERILPQAEFWPAGSSREDFNTLMNARHLVASVSTFCWMAALLSLNAAHIYLPVCGLFNPRQRPDIDLLPHADPRFHYALFPVQAWRARAEDVRALWSGESHLEELNPGRAVALNPSKAQFVL